MRVHRCHAWAQRWSWLKTARQNSREVAPIVAVRIALGNLALEIGGADEALAERNLFRRGDLEALALLDGGDEIRGLDQAVGRAGVEPGIAATHPLARSAEIA